MNIENYRIYKKNSNPKIIINGIDIKKDKLIIAGPCTVYNKDELIEQAIELKKLGVNVLRGGVFKPRTSPYDFQGLGEQGLDYLLMAKKITGLPIITEIPSIEYIDLFNKNVDIIQVGAKNMFNYDLLKALGKTNKPILLKRNMSATIEEWLNAAEYIVKNGNDQVILCERGIRTFEKETRNTLDIQAIPVIQKYTNLPIIVDPSHASGERYIVPVTAKASIVAGADGLIIETSKNPDKEICDSKQTIDLDTLKDIIEFVKKEK